MNSTETLPEVQSFSFTIPSEKLSALNARIDTLNRKAAKLNIAPLTVEIGREEAKDVGEGRKVLVTPVSISFAPIRAAGNFRFLASIEHESVNGTSHNIVSGYNLTKEEEASFRHIPSECHHCNHKRIRNSTFIVKNSEGETKQIGSSCIESYLGVDVKGAIFSLMMVGEIANFEDDFGMGGSKGERYTSLINTVIMSVATINKFGFVSSSKAKEAHEFGDFSVVSTASEVLTQLFPPMGFKDADRTVPTENDVKTGEEIVKTWNDTLVPHMDDDTLDQFQYKIALTCSLEIVKPRLHNTVVGSVGFALRKLQEQKSPKAVCDEFLPGVEVKSKIEIELTVARLHKFDGQYGTTTILSFKDKDGRNCVWFASGSLDEQEWVVGSTVKVKGTVKDLKVDAKYGRQTILTRVKRI